MDNLFKKTCIVTVDIEIDAIKPEEAVKRVDELIEEGKYYSSGHYMSHHILAIQENYEPTKRT